MRKPCCDTQGNVKGAWSKLEDQKLIDYVTTHGEGCWRSLPKAAVPSSADVLFRTSEKKVPGCDQWAKTSLSECDPLPTLLLFR
ncbi:hypothetical protein Tsubulata_003689 [Turnera subulata]|uniref:Myb-like domain-containing protein n=1 Tax=Turnera subulata TaxID=218843 RepID=A0A9Q0GE07_9ROSI|nr:hypothetical protein Tsubulata_003689 [Turnera subulata]